MGLPPLPLSCRSLSSALSHRCHTCLPTLPLWPHRTRTCFLTTPKLSILRTSPKNTSTSPLPLSPSGKLVCSTEVAHGYSRSSAFSCSFLPSWLSDSLFIALYLRKGTLLYAPLNQYTELCNKAVSTHNSHSYLSWWITISWPCTRSSMRCAFTRFYENGTSGEYLAPSKCAETRAFQPTIELVVLLFAQVPTLG